MQFEGVQRRAAAIHKRVQVLLGKQFSADAEQRLRTNSRMVLQRMYETGECESALLPPALYAHLWKDIPKVRSKYDDHACELVRQRTADIFVQEACAQIEHHMGVGQMYDVRLRAFGRALNCCCTAYEDIHDSSSCLYSNLLLPTMLRLTELTTLCCELQETIGPFCAHACVVHLSSCLREEVDEFVRQLQEHPVPQVLDFLQMCEVLFAHAQTYIAADDETAERAMSKIKHILRQVRDQNRGQLVKYALQCAGRRIQSEMTRNTIRTNRPMGMSHESRLPDAHAEKASSKDVVLVGGDPALSENWSVRRIAADASGFFDQADMLQLYGRSSDASPKWLALTSMAQDDVLNPFPDEARDDVPLLFMHLHRPSLQVSIEHDLGIDLSTMSLASQLHLLRFLQDADAETFAEVRAILQAHPADAPAILSSFLACSEERDFGLVILYMVDNAGPIDIMPVFHAYAGIAEAAQDNARMLVEWTRNIDPQTKLTVADVYRGLLKNANALLLEANYYVLLPGDRAQRGIDQLLSKLQQENVHQTVAHSFFIAQAVLLEGDRNVSLERHEDMLQFVLHALDHAHAKSLILRSLQKMYKLAPIPEIFWKVDRNAQDYARRYGLDVKEFLRTFSTDDRKQTVLEFGPGNGTFKEELQKATGDRYRHFAMCDKLYWPINTLLRQLIDFDALEAEAGALSDADRDLLCDFLYKILVIREGEAGADTFHYDEEVQKSLENDPQTIVKCLRRKCHLFARTDAVPGGGGIDDAGVSYVQKVQKPSSPVLQQALLLLSDPGTLDTYLRRVDDIYDVLPAYPPGTMVSDFSRVDRLADQQIDAAFAVRSTVYKTGEEYRDFLVQMTKKISADGIFIDDSVRENFGSNYRLADLRDVQRESGFPLHVILGPGMRGEDFSEGQSVPLALVMTRSGAKLQYIRDHLEDSYKLVLLDGLLTNDMYIATLAGGRTLALLQDVVTVA